jgi:hypothetical protein
LQNAYNSAASQTAQYYGNYPQQQVQQLGVQQQQQFGGRQGGMGGGGRQGGMGGGGGRKGGMGGGGKGESLRSLRAGKGEVGGAAAKMASMKKQHGGQGMRRRPNNDGRKQLATEMSQLQQEQDYEGEVDGGKFMFFSLFLIDDVLFQQNYLKATL